MKKSIVVGIILIFLLSSLIPMTSSHETIDENGTLSGYITDPAMNPIEGVVIRASCGENYFENFSDSSGYYYIDNIPIVFCLWNVSASKTGYKTIWAEMSIGENTTYDFVLTPLGKTLYVGGSGAGNYSKIQDGIDNASDGDTIFVYNGTYYENIVVNKSIILIGEDVHKTIIYGSGEKKYYDAVYIESDFVICNNFMISLSGMIPESDDPYDDFTECGMHILSNNNIVSNIIVESREMNEKSPYFSGVTLYKCQNNTISNCIIKVNGIALSLFGSNGNIFWGNSIFTSYSNYLENANNNTFIQNNFFRNAGNLFLFHFKVLNSDDNNWDKNFWNRPRVLPKLILLSYIIIETGEWKINITFDWHPAKEPFDLSGEKKSISQEISEYNKIQPTPKCNTKWFFLCNINSSGFVDQAYEFLQGKYIGVMYYGSSQGDFGKVVVNKIMKRFDSNHVYSIFVYGFKGETSWNRTIEENSIWMDGFAIAVCIKY